MLAVIGTFYKKFEPSRRALQAVLDSTRRPDEFWVMCERDCDLEHALSTLPADPSIKAIHCPTPKSNGHYLLVPYSFKINYALDHSKADLFAYLDNDSTPHIDKYALMEEALVQSPDWGAVYCWQHRIGCGASNTRPGDPITAPLGGLNFTQVMHRTTPARWNLDLGNANPDVVDGMFFEDLVKQFGPIHPVSSSEVLDTHNIPFSYAQGLEP